MELLDSFRYGWDIVTAACVELDVFNGDLSECHLGSLDGSHGGSPANIVSIGLNSCTLGEMCDLPPRRITQTIEFQCHRLLMPENGTSSASGRRGGLQHVLSVVTSRERLRSISSFQTRRGSSPVTSTSASPWTRSTRAGTGQPLDREHACRSMCSRTSWP